ENDVGEPISRVISSAISRSFAAYSPEKACTTSIRSCGDIRGHGPSSKARRAAATAASMSPTEPSGTRATTSSECGETTSSRADVAGVAHSPSMKNASRSWDIVSLRSRLRGFETGAERPPQPPSWRQREPVGEAAGVVSAEGAVLEEPPALGTVTEGPADVV